MGLAKIAEIIKAYGIIGYPIHKIRKFIGKFTGNKIVIYDELIKNAMEDCRNENLKELEQIAKRKNVKKNVIDKLKRKCINGYLQCINAKSYIILNSLLKNCNAKEERELFEKQRIFNVL